MITWAISWMVVRCKYSRIATDIPLVGLLVIICDLLVLVELTTAVFGGK